MPIVSIVTSSYLNFFCKKENKFLSNGLVKVRVLPPFETMSIQLENINEVVEQFQERMQAEFDSLNREIQLDSKYYENNDNNNKNN